MKFDFGTIVVIVVVLLFYLRLILLQWGKSRRLRDLQTILPKSKKGQPAAVRPSTAEVMRFRFGNIYLTVLAIVLMVAGALMVAIPSLDPQIRQLWWLPVSLGVVLFGFMIR
jgi:hypothetical protein